MKHPGSGYSLSSSFPGLGNTNVPLKLMVQVGGEASSITEDLNSNQMVCQEKKELFLHVGLCCNIEIAPWDLECVIFNLE